MHFLLSSQSSGCLQVVRARQGKEGIRIKTKGKFGIGGRSNFVQKIEVFSILNKHYIAVARNAGLVQLYEKMSNSGLDAGGCVYKLVKEWKNSTTSRRDPIIGIGSFRNQYMYTCSGEGKLVIRDLINDDADDSVKSFVIDGPLSCIAVETVPSSSHILVAAGGKGNSLKLYDFDFATSDFIANFDNFASFGGHLTRIGLTSSAPEGHSLIRRTLSIRNSFVDVRRLVPVADSSSSKADIAKGTRSAYWVSSVALWKQGSARKAFAGTQFGELHVFDFTTPYKFVMRPSKVLQLSQFCINALKVFNNGQYLVYTDSMSKAGVIDIHTMRVVNFYDYLRIGPTLSSRIYSSGDNASKISGSSQTSKFSPLYVVTTTIDGVIVIYKLRDSNEKELCLRSSFADVIPSFDFLESDTYNRLDSLFGDKHSQETSGSRQADAPMSKRRKANEIQTDADFMKHASSSVARGHSTLMTPHEHNDGLVNDIKTMKLAN